MSVKLGLDAKLYYCVAGPGGTPTWLELTNVKNVTLSLQKGEADVTTRANSGWKATAGTLKEGSIEFEMVWDTAPRPMADAAASRWPTAWGPARAAMCAASPRC